jgi:hypothetical protein
VETGQVLLLVYSLVVLVAAVAAAVLLAQLLLVETVDCMVLAVVEAVLH